ncbi:Hypothetical protein GLP15_1278 [Giardia lamblia P15]|uniref:Nucleolar protein 12 n=1 Tax=Giardia intestinalis (strain P15) TaxID=658858 RepID=E1EZN5_GIAIA|nr:Hypothetical protein GLP15_1278 [Giardia lamblia P15]
MPSQYLPTDPSGRKKILRKRITGEAVKFDEDALQSFVTGGHKRKEERRRKAQQEIKNKKLEEQRMKRREKEAAKRAELRKTKALVESNIYLKKTIEELRSIQKERMGSENQQTTEERSFVSPDGMCIKAVIKSL